MMRHFTLEHDRNSRTMSAMMTGLDSDCCTVLWFGGDHEERPLSRVRSWNLALVGNLPILTVVAKSTVTYCALAQQQRWRKGWGRTKQEEVLSDWEEPTLMPGCVCVAISLYASMDSFARIFLSGGFRLQTLLLLLLLLPRKRDGHDMHSTSRWTSTW